MTTARKSGWLKLERDYYLTTREGFYNHKLLVVNGPFFIWTDFVYGTNNLVKCSVINKSGTLLEGYLNRWELEEAVVPFL